MAQQTTATHAKEILHEIQEGLATVDMIAATSKLQMEAADVRANKPNWKSYLQGQMIPQEDYNFIMSYEICKSTDERRQLLEKSKSQCARTLLNLMTNVSKDQTVRYVLTLIDDMLQVSSIAAKLACWSQDLMDGSDLKYYFGFLKEQLRMPGNEYIQTSARCLQMMLRIDEYRHVFVDISAFATLVSCLAGKANFQLQYQLIFCIWCLTFNPSIAERMHKNGVIPTLADILSESTKEKVVRVILATFRNILEKSEDPETARENALQMVQSKVLKSLEIMGGRKYDDTDLTEDIEYLAEQLQNSVQDVSSFTEYCTELKSGRLQWSPVHKSEKFWKENAARFNEKNFELIKILIKILEVATDPLILCVAAHDIGEYVRHYPRGKTFVSRLIMNSHKQKIAESYANDSATSTHIMATLDRKRWLMREWMDSRIIENLNGKQQVMRLLAHEDPNVRYAALLAVQKIMVHNWEYLGKQLEKQGPEQDASGKAKSAIVK